MNKYKIAILNYLKEKYQGTKRECVEKEKQIRKIKKEIREWKKINKKKEKELKKLKRDNNVM